MKNLYCFIGLGADEKVFGRLELQGYTLNFIQWEIPKRGETIAEYAARLSSKIPESNPILVGLSFGGMVAIEVSKLIPTEKVIMISSAKTKNEIPWLYRVAGTIRLHRIIPTVFLKWANPLSYWLFGVQSIEDKALLKGILRDTDTTFLKWAINAIVLWDNKIVPSKYAHIHGEKDRILPLSRINGALVLQGGHLMIWNDAKAISKAVVSVLNKDCNIG